MSMDGRYVAKSQGWRCGECPWMDGLKIAPAFSALPTSMWGVCCKEPGMAVRRMSMDGRADNCFKYSNIVFTPYSLGSFYPDPKFKEHIKGARHALHD